MNSLYLILHKVRGEPAFDVAEEINPDLWIIPTSGHRAHPFSWWPLLDNTVPSVRKTLEHTTNLPGWYDLPDHYSAAEPRAKRAASTPQAPTTDDLLNL